MYIHILNGIDDRFRVGFSSSKNRKRVSYTIFYKGAFGDKPMQKRGSIDRRMMYIYRLILKTLKTHGKY